MINQIYQKNQRQIIKKLTGYGMTILLIWHKMNKIFKVWWHWSNNDCSWINKYIFLSCNGQHYRWMCKRKWHYKSSLLKFCYRMAYMKVQLISISILWKVHRLVKHRTKEFNLQSHFSINHLICFSLFLLLHKCFLNNIQE